MNAAKYSAVVLTAIGLYIAAYFTLVYYGLLGANTKLMPSVCRLEEHSCKTVLGTKYARVFGVPNSLLGVLYYLIVISVLLGGWTAVPVSTALIAVAWYTVALGVVLAYALFFIIKIPCPLCLTGHTINLTLAVLLTAILG
ncbi:MAG: vitamin K epoxide reductase family protein [Acidobacteriota bacterium]